MNEQELKEYSAYLLSQGFTPEEATEYMAEQGVQMPKAEPGIGSKALDYGLRALDYVGGLTRTGAGEVADAFVEGDAVTGEDWTRAVKGQAPGSAELMDRLGVPEGGKVNLFPEVRVPFTDVTLGEGDSSYRDIGGFVGDVLADPLTYASLGTSTAAKGGLSGALKGASKTAKKAGEALYRSGVKHLDKEAVAAGLEGAGKVLFDNKIWGTTEGIRDAAKAAGEKAMYERDLLYRSMPEAKVNPLVANEGAKRRLLEKIDKLPPGHPDRTQAEEALALMEMYERGGPVGLQTASDYKTQIRDELGSKAYDPVSGKKLDIYDAAAKDAGHGWQKAIEDAAGPYGQDLAKLNQMYGAGQAIQKPSYQQIKREIGRDMVTQPKAGISVFNPAATAAMYAAQLWNATPVRTGLGVGLDRLGDTGVLDPLTRQILIQQNRSPYEQMMMEQER